MTEPAPRPLDEADRLKALEAYRLMDTEPERAYDDIVELAAYICGTPIALVTLLDAERQWFKARVGLDAEQTTRDEAFCSYTILGTDVMVVPDAAADPLFASHPLVTAGPKIRFYAGAPLETPSGHRLGSLCVVDLQARDLEPDQLAALQQLARMVVDQFELRRTTGQLADALQRVRTLGELIPVCAYCRRVRDDNEYWQVLEEYLKKQVGSDVSHGICPECYDEHFADEETDPTPRRSA